MPYSVLKPFNSYNRRFVKDDIIEDGADLGGLSVDVLEGKFIRNTSTKKAAKMTSSPKADDEALTLAKSKSWT